MRAMAGIVIIFGITAPLAMGGTVRFNPAVTRIDGPNPPSSVRVNVSLISDSGQFDNINMLFGSNDGVTLDFEYSQAALTDFGGFIQPTAPDPVRLMIYSSSDILVGGFTFVPKTASRVSSYLLGVLTVHLPETISPGQSFSFRVNSLFDGGASSIGLGGVSDREVRGLGLIDGGDPVEPLPGETVLFHPPVMLVEINDPPPSVNVDMYLISPVGTFNHTEVLFGTHDPLVIDFAFSPQAILDFWSRSNRRVEGLVTYLADHLWISGQSPIPREASEQSPYLLGTLTLHLPDYVSVGQTITYEVDSFLFPVISFIARAGVYYPLRGFGQIEVVGSSGAVAFVSAEPPDNGTLPQVFDNTISVTFSAAPPDAPGPGEVTLRELLPDGSFGPDLSVLLSISVDRAQLIVEDPENILQNGHWYGLRNPGTWPGVGAFCLDLQAKFGDADGDGRTEFSDLSVMNQFVAQRANEKTRRNDIDGNGLINFADISKAYTYVSQGPAPVPKPSGHPSVCVP